MGYTYLQNYLWLISNLSLTWRSVFFFNNLATLPYSLLSTQQAFGQLSLYSKPFYCLPFHTDEKLKAFVGLQDSLLEPLQPCPLALSSFLSVSAEALQGLSLCLTDAFLSPVSTQ